MSNACPLCGYDCKPAQPRTGSRKDFDCENCGKFSVSDMITDLPKKTPAQRAILSHVVRKGQRDNTSVQLISYWIDDILKTTKLPSPMEQMNNLVLWMGENSHAGEKKELRPENLQALVGAVDRVGFRFILNYMFNVYGFLTGESPEAVGVPQDGGIGPLTPKGWEQYEQLKRGTAFSRKAFMAMPFDEGRLDRVFMECFVAAVKATGFDLERVDSQPKAGSIDDKIRVDILTARFVIADLTDNNLGVYWESGFAEGLGKPVIYTCEKKFFDENGTHFDTNHHLTIFWEENKLNEAAEKLTNTIRATLPSEAKLTD